MNIYNNYITPNTLDANLDNTLKITLITLSIVGTILLFALILFVLYLIVIARRTNIVMKKVDYLIEDITYKSESLSVSVDTLNKFSNYLLAFDATTKKNLKSAIHLVSENRDYIYKVLDKVKAELNNSSNSKKTKPTSKDAIEKKQTKTTTSKKNTTQKIQSKKKTEIEDKKQKEKQND